MNVMLSLGTTCSITDRSCTIILLLLLISIAIMMETTTSSFSPTLIIRHHNYSSQYGIHVSSRIKVNSDSHQRKQQCRPNRNNLILQTKIMRKTRTQLNDTNTPINQQTNDNNNNNNNNNNMVDSQLGITQDRNSISDEDVLLACRAYLQRKNKLNGWTQYEKRKQLARRSLALSSLSNPIHDNKLSFTSPGSSNIVKSKGAKNNNYNDGNSSSSSNSAITFVPNDGVGYFWENPNELKYLRKGRPRMTPQDFENTDNNNDHHEYRYSNDITNYYDNDDDQNSILQNRKKQQEEEEHQFYNPNLGFITMKAKDEYSVQKGKRYYDDTIITNKRDNSSNYDDMDAVEGENIELGELFNSYPSVPPKKFLARSKIAKSYFQNKEWKARWYEKRWGGHSNNNGSKSTTNSNTNSSNSNDRNQIIMGPIVQTDLEKTQRKKEKLISQIPNEILSSPILLNSFNTTQDISNAVDIYLSSKRKKSIAQLERNRLKKQSTLKLLRKAFDEKLMLTHNDTTTTTTTTNNNNSSSTFSTNTTTNGWNSTFPYMVSNNDLLEARKKRSEKSRKAYQTRIDNAAAAAAAAVTTMASTTSTQSSTTTSKRGRKKSPTSTKTNQQQQQMYFSSEKTRLLNTLLIMTNDQNNHMNKKQSPTLAMICIKDSLAQKLIPSSDHVRILLKAKRLPGRKQLLKEILYKCFGLRGKCIPPLREMFPKIIVVDDSNKNNLLLEEPLESFVSFSRMIDGISTLSSRIRVCFDNDDMDRNKFVTTATIEEIGSFVLYLIDEIEGRN